MADKGKRDKGKREQQKKAKLTPKEKRQKKKDKKNSWVGTVLLDSYVLLYWSDELCSFPPYKMTVGPEKPAILRSGMSEGLSVPLCNILVEHGL